MWTSNTGGRRGVIERGRAREAGDRVFGRRVGRRIRARSIGGNRTVVDDAATARRLRLHQTKRLLQTQEGAGEIRAHHRRPLLVGEVFHRHGGRSHAGVVEQHVEAAPRRLHFRENLFYGGILSDIAGQYERARETLEVAGQIHPCRLVVVVGDPLIEQESLTASASVSRSGGAITIERIVLSATGRAIRHLESAMMGLLRPDLPRVVFWGGRPHGDLMRRAVESADRIITDSGARPPPMA